MYLSYCGVYLLEGMHLYCAEIGECWWWCGLSTNLPRARLTVRVASHPARYKRGPRCAVSVLSLDSLFYRAAYAPLALTLRTPPQTLSNNTIGTLRVGMGVPVGTPSKVHEPKSLGGNGTRNRLRKCRGQLRLKADGFEDGGRWTCTRERQN
jgi:hypothetical protein